MPTPRSGENQSDFVSRCISVVNKEEDKKDWSQDRKVAYCYSLWRQSKGESSLKFTVAGNKHALS